MAKGFLKGLFIEEETTSGGIENIDMSHYRVTDTDSAPETTLNVDTSELITIEQIYRESQTNLSDMQRSIFKIEEIRNVLPANLPNEAKKASVLGMMGVSGLVLEEVIYDTDMRESELVGVLEKYNSDINTNLVEFEELIASHEAAINDLKQNIVRVTKLKEDQKNIIEAELVKIKAIKDFIL